MIHGLNNQFLYSAYKLTSTFTDRGRNPVDAFGTAFFLRNKRDELSLVTNRHMIDLQYPVPHPEHPDHRLHQLLLRGKQSLGSPALPTANIEAALSLDAEILTSPTHANDVACVIKPKLFMVSPRSGMIDFHIPYDWIATKDDFDNKLSVCDFVAYPGYPEWHDTLNERPILRTGTLSSDPRADYARGGVYSGECVAFEAFSSGGSSGSPVFALQKGIQPGPGLKFPAFRRPLFIGINAGHMRAAENNEHSGISCFYKSTTILDIIDREPGAATPSPS